MAQTTAYSFKNVQATLDGQKVQGFFDGDDAVTVEPGADIGSMMIGADGSGLFSQSADASARITLRLQHTSPTHRLLLQKLRRQREAGGLSGFPFDVIDTRSGEGGNGERCFIMNAPTDGKGMNATVREWVLVTSEWNSNIPNEVQS